MPAALIYHDVAPPATREQIGFAGPLAARYKHTPERFDEHLDALQATGRQIGLAVPGRAYPDLMLTFDDGGASALDVAGRLEARGWRGHFFVTTGRIGTPGFLDAAGVRELAARGHAVGSHSVTHPTYMGRLSEPELAEEWTASRARLAELLGAPPALAAVPGGFLSPAVFATAAAAGYRVLMTSEPSRRPRVRDGLAVLGRYTIWASTPAPTAAAYARGDRRATGRLWLEWQAKGAAKRVSPRIYQALRRVRAR